MALAHDGTRQIARAETAPEGVIIVTALAAVPEVLREFGIDAEARPPPLQPNRPRSPASPAFT